MTSTVGIDETEIFRSAIMLGEKNLTETNKLLSIWGMTSLQHNALQVLYDYSVNALTLNDQTKDKALEVGIGAGSVAGLSSKEIGQRLYTRVPDVTRLLDRLADKGWVVRERDPNNKRVVRTRLTQIGTELVESAHAPIIELESKQLDHLAEAEKQDLLRLLKKALTSNTV